MTVQGAGRAGCRGHRHSTGNLVFDTSKPDGTPRKLLDSGRLARLGWKPRISLREGLQQTYADFCSRPEDQKLEDRDPADPGRLPPVSQCAF